MTSPSQFGQLAHKERPSRHLKPARVRVGVHFCNTWTRKASPSHVNFQVVVQVTTTSESRRFELFVWVTNLAIQDFVDQTKISLRRTNRNTVSDPKNTEFLTSFAVSRSHARAKVCSWCHLPRLPADLEILDRES